MKLKVVSGASSSAVGEAAVPKPKEKSIAIPKAKGKGKGKIVSLKKKTSSAKVHGNVPIIEDDVTSAGDNSGDERNDDDYSESRSEDGDANISSADKRPLVTRCRPHDLEKLMKNLTPLQKQDVIDVGFGSLFELKLKTLCRKMLPWVVQNFNGGSCMFAVGNGKEFVVTKNDVCDVFLLPMGDLPVPELKQTFRGQNVDNELVQAWRSHFGVSVKQPIPLSKLLSRMEELVDGGEEFKRCFVLFALCTFFTPTPNRSVSFKLLKAVQDVDAIKTYDWCSFVLNCLSKAVNQYKRDVKVKNVSGCLLLLEILYFHRLHFQGEVESSVLPLIQHWTDAKLKNRIKKELKAGGFGQGPLDTATYPISKSGPVPSATGTATGTAIAGGAYTSHSSRVIQFDLPDGVMTDDDIKKVATDGVHEAFLVLRRNLELFSTIQSKSFTHLQNLIRNVMSERCTPLASEEPVVSQTQQLLADPGYHKLLDSMIEEFLKMKSVNEDLFPAAAAENLDTDGGFEEEVNAAAAAAYFVSEEEATAAAAGKGKAPMFEKEINPLVVESVPAFKSRNNKALCTLDCGPIGHVMPYATLFLKNNIPIFKKMPRLKLEVLDYCLLKDDSFNSKLSVFYFYFFYVSLISFLYLYFFFKICSENLVTFGLHFMVPREDMHSLCSPAKIRWSIVDCYALYLNEAVQFDSSRPQRFYFSARHSFAFMSIYDSEVAGAVTSTATVDELHGLSDSWVDYENDIDEFMGADLIYFPILAEDYYVLFVFDHRIKRVYYVDNIIWHDTTFEYFKNMSASLGDQLSYFLSKRKHPKADLLPSYKFEKVTLPWMKEKPDNTDCGVFVIYHMHYFVGSSFECEKLNTVGGRKFLHGEICSNLVLCDKNESRSEVLDCIQKFNVDKMNPQYINEIEKRRKSKVVEKNKKRTKNEDATAKTATKRVKKAPKKYTPSKEDS